MQIFKKAPFLPAVLFFIITVILLTLPGTSFPKSHFFDIPYFDKWVHIGIFSILCFLFSFPLIDFSIPDLHKKYWFLFILLMGIVYGILMEFVQKYWVANRSFDEMDMVADAVGCILSWLISLQILKKKNS